jgi:hypothetical protein
MLKSRFMPERDNKLQARCRQVLIYCVCADFSLIKLFQYRSSAYPELALDGGW